MSPFGKRCAFCGLYIKLWNRGKHEAWHAQQVLEIRKLLCNHCMTLHSKQHKPCEKYPDCRCVCNAFGVDE
jgi:hypothetical protein